MIPPGEQPDRAPSPRRAGSATTGPGTAVDALRSRLTHPTVFLEVLCSPVANGVDLRHVQDAGRSDPSLELLEPAALGVWSERTPRDAFRPNRAAPTLRPGWRCHAATDDDLHEALEQLYPGALADWHAWETGSAEATTFRAFASRQGGMYRVVQDLTDAGADAVARSGCREDLCLRRRCWSAPGVGMAPWPEGEPTGLAIPCLEPCALVLDLARWMAQDEKEDRLHLEMTREELASMEVALRATLEHPPGDLREGSTRHPANPRRLHLLLARLRELQTRANPDSGNKGT